MRYMYFVDKGTEKRIMPCSSCVQDKELARQNQAGRSNPLRTALRDLTRYDSKSQPGKSGIHETQK